MYSTDNGAEVHELARRRHNAVQRREEHELGGRLPRAVPIRWPGVIKPGTVFNDLGAHEDMIPTLMAAAGEPDIVAKLKKGYTAGEQELQGPPRRLQPAALPRGETKESPRKEFLYWTDDGDLSGLRYEQWKIVFMEQRAHRLDVWQEPFVPLRHPKLFTLRGDPFERAEGGHRLPALAGGAAFALVRPRPS